MSLADYADFADYFCEKRHAQSVWRQSSVAVEPQAKPHDRYSPLNPHARERVRVKTYSHQSASQRGTPPWGYGHSRAHVAALHVPRLLGNLRPKEGRLLPYEMGEGEPAPGLSGLVIRLSPHDPCGVNKVKALRAFQGGDPRFVSYRLHSASCGCERREGALDPAHVARTGSMYGAMR